MTKLFNIIYALLLGSCILSCEKFPENGHLDGQWQLLEIHTKSNIEQNSYDAIMNKKEDAIYWKFHNDLVMIMTYQEALNGYTNSTLGRIVYGNNQLNITHTYIHYENRDSLLNDPNTNLLEAIGIKGNKANFDIEKLNNKQMILKSEYNKLYFRKF